MMAGTGRPGAEDNPQHLFTETEPRHREQVPLVTDAAPRRAWQEGLVRDPLAPVCVGRAYRRDGWGS